MEALIAAGYKVFDGETDIPGKGSHHMRKPDYIAVKAGAIVIGEIKSPKEPPTTASWRQVQPNDSEQMKTVRLGVARREAIGQLPKEIGGHEIIILGQIPDYIKRIGETYDLPRGVDPRGKIVAGYTMPDQEAEKAKQALTNCGAEIKEIVRTGNVSTTYIFILRD